MARAQLETFGEAEAAGRRVLQFSSICFDASVFETLLSLPAGATLCLGTRDSLIPGRPLTELLHRHSVTTVLLPPSALPSTLPGGLPIIELVTVAGEALPADAVTRWAPGRRFFNLYGPTETTIWTIVAECFPAGRRRPLVGRSRTRASTCSTAGGAGAGGRPG